MAIFKKFSVRLDLKVTTSGNDFRVVEDDTGNIVEITLTDSGVPVDLTDARVIAVFSKSNGTSMQDSNEENGGITIGGENNNVVTIDLFNTSLAPGMVECELQIYTGPNFETLVTTARFNFSCYRGIFNSDTIESTDDYPILVDLITKVEVLQDIALKLEGLDVEAETLSPGSEATAEIDKTGEFYKMKFGIPEGQKGEQGIQGIQGIQGEQGIQGLKGDTGNSGVYVGADEPTDPEIKVWIDIDAEPTPFGDMTKAVYDTDDDGIVDNAAYATQAGSAAQATLATSAEAVKAGSYTLVPPSVSQQETLAIQPRSASALPASGTALTDNTIYNVTDAVTSYAFMPPATGWAHGTFTTGTGVSISFSGSFIGEAPSIEDSTQYEFDVWGNVWAVAEVVSA